MLNWAAFETPLPGPGLKTVISDEPVATMSEGGIAALSCVDEMKVVNRVLPFHRMVPVGAKFVPMTTRVKPGPPTVADFGINAVIAGTGFVAFMTNGSAFELTPSTGLKTVTLAEPGAAISAAEISALNSLADTKVVVLVMPFHRTIELPRKFEPVTVSENAEPPAIAEPGLRAVMVGPTCADTTAAPNESASKAAAEASALRARPCDDTCTFISSSY
jgi:hypothetical protein